jgi:hypothetical protein
MAGTPRRPNSHPGQRANRQTAMKAIDPIRAGLVLGAVVGAWHLCWALLVAAGWAQMVIDFIFWMHFIKPVYVVGPFDTGIAAVLVIVTFLLGFLLAFVFALLWNRFHRI